VNHAHSGCFLLLPRCGGCLAEGWSPGRGRTEEERFSRIKHDYGFPKNAIRFCLEQGGINGPDLDYGSLWDSRDKIMKTTCLRCGAELYDYRFTSLTFVP
jgi:hypothetical protein